MYNTYADQHKRKDFTKILLKGNYLVYQWNKRQIIKRKLFVI